MADAVARRADVVRASTDGPSARAARRRGEARGLVRGQHDRGAAAAVRGGRRGEGGEGGGQVRAQASGARAQDARRG